MRETGGQLGDPFLSICNSLKIEYHSLSLYIHTYTVYIYIYILFFFFAHPLFLVRYAPLASFRISLLFQRVLDCLSCSVPRSPREVLWAAGTTTAAARGEKRGDWQGHRRVTGGCQIGNAMSEGRRDSDFNTSCQKGCHSGPNDAISKQQPGNVPSKTKGGWRTICSLGHTVRPYFQFWDCCLKPSLFLPRD